MQISIASDRAGLELKTFLIEELEKQNYNMIDLGTNNNDSVDYPDYAKKVVNSILIENTDLGILICGTGIGMSITANRYKNIRAALCSNPLEAKLAREHNDANIICLGARMIGKELALENVNIFLNTKFSGERHLLRIKKIDR